MTDEAADHTVRAGEALSAFLKRDGLLEKSRDAFCAYLWPQVAGAWYARHSFVTSVRDGVVNVRCDSAPRAQQLQLDAPEIIARLNERLGERYVREIRPSSAGVGRRKPPPTAEPREPEFPTDEELAEIRVPPERIEQILELAQGLEGPLRRRLEEVMLLQARLDIWRRDHGWVRCPGCGAYHLDSDDYCLACRPLERPSNAGGEEGLSAFFE